MGLELYAKVEELFLDKEAAYMLWYKFIEVLKELNVKNFLDIGCGNGEFCLIAQKEGFKVEGLDLSENQVKKALKKGCRCHNVNVCEFNKKFESATAVFDVINYMDKKELKSFFKCVKERIEKYFIFDINTIYAMEDLAIGTLKAEDKNRFSVLYSEFENNKLITEITLFEKKDKNCYEKHQKSIIQYYHSIEEIEKISGMKLKEIIPISLYGSEEAEKLIIVMEK
ncbi:MAG: methyltransferase domain-containing protein [Nautiliaceae bacterium]